MNSWLKFFNKKPENSAQTAKDRLQIIVARERTACGGAPGYLPQLQQELMQVIAKYERVDLDRVQVNIDRKGDTEVLELCIMLPEGQEAPVQAPLRGRPLFA
ncbi:MAG: cell division topological specificity factor MinE [Myxococcales bacterium]